jgi:hypothetical protein
MTGSGKTGLCVTLLEEAALDAIPAIAIDPKGDLGNLLLTFPELRPSDFRPWIDPAEAARAGRSPDEHARAVAELWAQGLAEWGQDGARIARLRAAVDVALYTPGSSAGRPLSLLRSFDAPPPSLAADPDLLRERVGARVAGLLALLGVEADPLRSREHILVAKLLEDAWRAGRSLDLAGLVHAIQDPGIGRVGVVDLESFFPAPARSSSPCASTPCSPRPASRGGSRASPSTWRASSTPRRVGRGSRSSPSRTSRTPSACSS